MDKSTQQNLNYYKILFQTSEIIINKGYNPKYITHVTNGYNTFSTEIKTYEQQLDTLVKEEKELKNILQFDEVLKPFMSRAANSSKPPASSAYS